MNSYGVLSWDSSTAEFRVYATSGNELKLSANGHNSHITIATDGDVGIGTTSPGEKLDVAGDIRVRGAGGSIGGTTIGNASFSDADRAVNGSVVFGDLA